MVRSIYRDIYRELSERIESGTYAFQTQIPTEDALCARFSCSHSTVRRALQELARAGYVQARQGSGVTVIWQPTPQDANGYATGGIEIFPEVCAERGLTPATELLNFETLVANEQLASTTGLPKGAEVVHMRRLRLADGKPVALEETHTLASEVPDITPQIALTGTYAYIEQTLGIKIATSKRRISMSLASNDVANLLHVSEKSYVACIESNTFDASGKMFEHIKTYQHPDFFSISIIATR